MFASLMPDLIAIDAGPAESLRIASRAGFSGIDLRMNRFAEEVERLDARVFAAAIDAAGLVPGYCSIAPQKMDIPEKDWRAEIASVPRRAKLAREIGYRRATSVVVPGSDSLAFDANMQLHVDRTREVADLLSPHGIMFGLEYVSPLTRRDPLKHEFIHDLGGMLDLLDRVDRGNVGVMLDCFHWCCAGETPDDIRRLDAERVVAVHVNDLVAGVPMEDQTVFERELPGETGRVDIASFLGTLAEIGYDGPITAEPTNAKWRRVSDARAAEMTFEAIDRCLRSAGVAQSASGTRPTGSGRRES